MPLQKDWLNSLNKKNVESFKKNCDTCELGFAKDRDPHCLAFNHNRKTNETCENYSINFEYFQYISHYVKTEGCYPKGTPQDIIQCISNNK